MVNDLRIPWAHFRGCDPRVFGERIVHQHVLVFDSAGGRNVEYVGHFNNEIGLEIPAILECQGRRFIFRVAFRCAVVGPGR